MLLLVEPATTLKGLMVAFPSPNGVAVATGLSVKVGVMVDVGVDV
jgi:hypothetical protein